MEAKSCRSVLMCQGLRVLVQANTSNHLEWLKEFVSPHFEFTAQADHDVEVRLIDDDDRHAHFAARGAVAPERNITCFMLDSKTLRYRCWNSTDGTTAAYDHDAKVFYDVEYGGRVVTVLNHTGDVRGRVPWMRVTRELAMSHAYGAGKLLLHASGCVLNDKGLIVTAPSNGGKTTLLMHMLHRGGAGFLSNDRLAISLRASGAWIRGIPTIVTIRPGSLRMMPEIHARLRNSSYNHRLTLREAAAERCGPPQPWKDGRIGLSPTQFCNLFATTPVAQAKACAVVLPVITGEAGGCVVREIPPAQAAERLTQTLFAARWLSEPSELFAFPGMTGAPLPESLALQCEKLAQMVPCLECHLGQQAYEAPNYAADALARAVAKL